MSLRTKLLASVFFTSFVLAASAEETPKKEGVVSNNAAEESALTQIAILLDTSGSMSGLIDQARCQLWNAVSELATASREGKPIDLEIAVYQYGSRFIPQQQGFLRQVIGFTDSLDEVSRALFSLEVGGSKEFCSQAINHALDELEGANPRPIARSSSPGTSPLIREKSLRRGPSKALTKETSLPSTAFRAKRRSSQPVDFGCPACERSPLKSTRIITFRR